MTHIRAGYSLCLTFQSSVNDQLEWLKGVKDSHGDVGVNSLKEVKAINERGICIIGHRKDQHSKVGTITLCLIIW